MRIKIVATDEKITRRSGMIVVNEFGKRINLSHIINEAFPRPGSNKGKDASEYVITFIEMFHDGALHLEDVRLLLSDTAYQELAEVRGYPSADALGDWLRRYGGDEGENNVWKIQRQVLAMSKAEACTLDIDATIIEADKGDAKMSYKRIRGYHPLVGIIAENGLVVGSEFREGNHSPQSGLREFIEQCRENYPGRITTIRSDSAGWKRDVVEWCLSDGLFFTITADQNSAVLNAIREIPETAWKGGIERDGVKASWEVAETGYTFSSQKKLFRLVAKRERLTTQLDMFDSYKYWIVGTNLSLETYDANAVVVFHQQRGGMERTLGELKHQYNLDHLPCGQYEANSLYFTIGLLAYNLMQLVKIITLPKDEWKKSVRTLRYRLLHLAGRVIHHARYALLRVAAPIAWVESLAKIYLTIRVIPLSG